MQAGFPTNTPHQILQSIRPTPYPKTIYSPATSVLAETQNPQVLIRSKEFSQETAAASTGCTTSGSLRHKHLLYLLEEEMGRCQCKNIYKNIKSNVASSEPSGSTIVRPEHHDVEEAEESSLKNNFMNIIEAFKKEMNNSLKEIEKKTNKKLEEINKSLKESQENQEKDLNRCRKPFNAVDIALYAMNVLL
ncbi:hypothetical protein STEG23_030732, partial [Scotinomys teguina]